MSKASRPWRSGAGAKSLTAFKRTALTTVLKQENVTTAGTETADVTAGRAGFLDNDTVEVEADGHGHGFQYDSKFASEILRSNVNLPKP